MPKEIYNIVQFTLKAHLHGIPEVVSVLRNEAIMHVSGMQSSCKGHNNIIACSASYSKHESPYYFIFSCANSRRYM